MGLWGATAGVATLVGPLAGGLLVDGLGWEWIFFVNVPVGVIAFVLAYRFVPKLATRPHRFDILGVVLSAVGLFMLVFGLQEGETYNWGTITGPISVWSLIIAGIVVLGLFVLEQATTKREPLLPLALFRDRNFSLANIAMTAVGFTVTSFALPLVFFFQVVRGLTPTQSALMLVPMAAVNIALARFVGRLTDRMHPRYLAVPGLLLFSLALWLYSSLLSPTIGIGWLLIPSAVLGLANAFTWSPISTTATRNLPPREAGAGAGVYNTTRQVGSVFGSAAIAVLIQARLAAELPGGGSASDFSFGTGSLPDAVKSGFTDAMAQTMVLPAIVVLVAAAAALCFQRPRMASWQQAKTSGAPATAPVTTVDPASPPGRSTSAGQCRLGRLLVAQQPASGTLTC